MKTLLLLLALCGPCLARVGEKYEEFLKRPGVGSGQVEIKGKVRIMRHTRAELRITVYVVDGLISMEIYNPIEPPEVLSLLNNLGVKWQEKGEDEWTAPGGLIASYGARSLLISDGKAGALMKEYDRAADAAAAKKKIDGL
jgi:hypothetical protein